MPHNCTRVAEWYNPNMEVQINVVKTGGIQASPGVYTDEHQQNRWYNVRIPKNAKTNPIDNDGPLAYPLDEYADAIGMTGWDWKNKHSIRFGFDIDDITSHAPGVGITEEEMDEVKRKAHEVPELLILRSTSGSGLHLYLECDPEHPPTTTTHTEHAALALAALQHLSKEVGFDFGSHLDVGGGNMWVWARKMTPENQGFTVIKDNVHENGTKAYYMPPDDWRNYLEVAQGKRSTPRVAGANDELQGAIDKHNSNRDNIQLTPEHKRVIDDLHEICPEVTTAWIEREGLLQTHTWALKKIFLKGDYLGVFDTLSSGTDPSKPNCFGYPRPDGGWKFIRFGEGATEAPEWVQAPGEWTYCFFNSRVTLSMASQNGAEDTTGKFVFDTQEEAIQAASALGSDLIIPEKLKDRSTTLSTHKDGRLIVEIETLSRQDKDLKITGWLKKRGHWIKIFGTGEEYNQVPEVDLDILDEIIRSLVTPEHESNCWAFKHIDGAWIHTKKDDAKTIISGGQFSKNSPVALATALRNSWTRVNLPFQPEYPGNRQWNCDGAQWAMQPADLEADVTPHHPHWDMIIRHCSQDLDMGLKHLPWAIENNIVSGYEYLMSWIVYVFRYPFRSLPYLFFHGLGGSGKSILHEALFKLATKGIVRADKALKGKDPYNKELAGAILCIVEEQNISTSPDAYARLKDWVTAVSISIRAMRTDVYDIRNSTHWMHMANDKDNCPVFPGDTRVISMHVPPFTNEEIPQEELLELLLAEAPHFLVSIQRWQLPEVKGRLQMPIIMTPTRSLQEETLRDALESYVADQCFYAPGETVLMKDFYSKFITTLTNTERTSWQKRNVISRLKNCFPVGNLDKHQMIGNISFALPALPDPKQHYVREGSVLTLLDIED